MAIEQFPSELRHRLINLRLREQTRSANVSMNGRPQVTSSATQRWSCDLTFNNLKADAILPYRGFLALARGQENCFKMPVRDTRLWLDVSTDSVPHDDDTLFDDDTDYGETDIVDVKVTGAAGDKTLTIPDVTSISGLKAGMYFGIMDDLYIVTSRPSTTVLNFEPSLRINYMDERMKLRPNLVVALAEDNTGDHTLDMNYVTAPTLSLVEILPDERPDV